MKHVIDDFSFNFNVVNFNQKILILKEKLHYDILFVSSSLLSTCIFKYQEKKHFIN